MYEFEYCRPARVSEAVAILKEDEEAKPLSGAQTLMPVLRARLAMPSKLVALGGIAECQGISLDGQRLRIGGAETHSSVAESDLVQLHLPVLSQLARGIGDRQVRNRGTLGGSIANNDPAACYPSACLALDAIIITDRREIAASEFFTAMFTTSLEPDEIVTAVSFPTTPSGCYVKFPNPASRFALIGAFAAMIDGAPRIAITGGGSGVFRWKEGEECAQRGGDLSEASLDPANFTSDIHASDEYRMQMTREMTKRALANIG